MDAGKLKNKRILVTGAAGFVGTNVLLKLAELVSCEIVAADFSPLKVSAKNISYIKADLENREDCEKIVKGIDYVLMFAARINRRGKDLSYLRSNIVMNFNVLEAAYNAGVKKCLWTSSATGYPPENGLLTEDRMFLYDPSDEYFGVGWTTRYIEKLAKMFSEKLERKMPVIILRPTAIYGPYCDFNLETCHVLPALIRKVAERQNPIEIWGNGQTKRDFVFVGDVVEAILFTLANIDEGDAFNIASGQPVSVKALLYMILEADGYKDAKIDFDLSKQSKKWTIAVSGKKAREVMGNIKTTSLKEGITKTLGWFKNNLLQKKSI